MDVVIRPLEPADAEGCDAVIRSLPDFFGHAGGIALCAAAVRAEPGWVAVDGEQIVGFATWQQRTAATAELTWMAVARDRRHAGIGTRIVEALVADLRERGYRLALVMTSAGSKGDTPDTYIPTRRFYESRGFLPLTALDIWDTNTALLMVRPIA